MDPAPIYVLPHGIEVMAEFSPNAKCPYWRVSILPHPFFPRSKASKGRVLVQRSRAVMASIVGRALDASEHVHHGPGGREDDSPGNLTLLSAADHNRHHKAGWKHSEESRAKISAGLKAAIAEGRRDPPPGGRWLGRKHSEESKARISATRKEMIANGSIKKARPPSPVGRKQSDETKAKMRAARLAWWRGQKARMIDNGHGPKLEGVAA